MPKRGFGGVVVIHITHALVTFVLAMIATGPYVVVYPCRESFLVKIPGDDFHLFLMSEVPCHL